MIPAGRRDPPSDRRLGTLLGVAAFCLLALTTGGHLSSVDELTTFRTTESLLHGQRSIDPAVYKAEEPLLLVTEHRGEPIGIYGIGPSAVGAIGYRFGELVSAAVGADARERDLLVRFGFVEASVAVAALAVPAAFALARALGAPKGRAAAAAVLGVFGSYLWVLGRTAWPDVPAATASTAALAAAIHAVRARNPDQRARAAIGAGLLAGAGLHFRLSVVLVIACVATYLAIAGRADRHVRATRLLAFGLGLVPGALVLLAVQWWRFGSPFDTGYPPLGFGTSLAHGLVGNLTSPGRGIVWYAPLALLGLGAGWSARRTDAGAHALLAGHAAAVALLFSQFTDWDAGHTYGPRYLAAAVLPLTAAVAVPPARWWARLVGGVGVAGVLLHGALGVVVYFGSVYAVGLPEAIADAGGEGPGVDRPEAQVAARFRLVEDWGSSTMRHAAQLLPVTVDRSLAAAGGDAGDIRPWPEDPLQQVGYWDDPSLVDVWWARWGPAGGDPWVLLLAPALLAAGGAASVGALRVRAVVDL